MMAKQVQLRRSQKCPICSEIVVIKNKRSHIDMHFGVEDFQCQFCDKVFSKRSSCQAHERVHSKKTLSDETLNNRDITVDVGLYKFPLKCKYCPKTFQFEWSMLRHLHYTHSEKRPYTCHFCPETFNDANHIWEHLETVHPKSNNNSIIIKELKDVQNSLKIPRRAQNKEEIESQSKVRVPESMKNVNLWPRVVLSRALSDAISKCGC